MFLEETAVILNFLFKRFAECVRILTRSEALLGTVLISSSSL